VYVAFYDQLPWFVSELLKKDISNVMVQCRQYSTISCCGLPEKISQIWDPVQVSCCFFRATQFKFRSWYIV
jgi:hypothetical protein